MFYGREKEIAQIDEMLLKPSAFVIIYGTRRVGKTELIKHSLKRSMDKTIYFECTSGALSYNIGMFLNTLEDCGFEVDRGKLTDFDRVFNYLNGFDETFNVVIDEYPYLKKSSKPDFIDSVFQNLVDRRLKNIRLFVSGSDVGMMKDLSTYDNALFGRATLIIELEQWNYKEATVCYPNLTPYDKVAFYSVFGGTPFVDIEIDPSKSLKENITAMYLTNHGAARVYADQLLMTASAKEKDSLEPILATLGNGRKKFTEIKNSVGSEHDFTLCNVLDTAVRLGLVAKVYPINKENNPKRVGYEIADNVLRFYYMYIYGRAGRIFDIGPDVFYDRYIAPTLTTFIAHRFEDICRAYFRSVLRAGEYKDACRVGTYFYDDPVNKTNGEFDVAIKIEPRRDMFLYDIYEVKYFEKPFSERRVLFETEQVEAIRDIKIQNVGFVSINGFEEDCDGILITGEDLYR
ncbi:MAG: ATP-binding protein [Clostridia bacterium]|nr:ATP-binding protein [Clostridia bacterium]